jgi:hypothetical protein
MGVPRNEQADAKTIKGFSFICQALVDLVHSMSICLVLLHPYIPMYAST